MTVSVAGAELLGDGGRQTCRSGDASPARQAPEFERTIPDRPRALTPWTFQYLVELFRVIQAETADTIRKISFAYSLSRLDRMHKVQCRLWQGGQDILDFSDRRDIEVMDSLVPEDLEQVF
jgi:hypothetical protein